MKGLRGRPRIQSCVCGAGSEGNDLVPVEDELGQGPAFFVADHLDTERLGSVVGFEVFAADATGF
jgi:hypothetical protein